MLEKERGSLSEIPHLENERLRENSRLGIFSEIQLSHHYENPLAGDVENLRIRPDSALQRGSIVSCLQWYLDLPSSVYFIFHFFP